MNNVSKTLVLAALAAFATPAVIHAAVPSTATQNVPGTMNYQGVLRNPSTGLPYADGIYTLDLRIWNNSSSTGSSGCLWGGQYSVYVKDGYFNVMLGDAAGKDLTTAPTGTYKNQELWKAMWGASDTATTYYLGVTPREDYRNAAIASPSEILPRQQLLSSPFAFRAQQAKYADASKATTFTAENGLTVNGATTLKGAVTFNGNITANGTGSQKFGPIATSSTSVALTGNTSKPTSSNYSTMPSVYDVGKSLYFYSYNAMTFGTTAGNMNFTVPANYKMSVSGAGKFESTAADNAIGGSGTTTITGAGASSININGTGSLDFISSSGRINLEAHGVSSSYLDSDSALWVRSVKNNLYLTASSNATITAANGVINLNGNSSSTGPGVKGQGNLVWAPLNSSGSADSPIRWLDITTAVPANGAQKQIDLSSTKISGYSDYDWVIINCTSPYGVPNVRRTFQPGSTTNTLWVEFTATSTQQRTVHVIMMGVHKAFTRGYASITL